jgi:hypothetical protein
MVGGLMVVYVASGDMTMNISDLDVIRDYTSHVFGTACKRD